jgi:hypothetical protein
MRQEVMEKDIIKKLGDKKILACLIKGNPVAIAIYNDPDYRSSVDIDLLLRTRVLKRFYTSESTAAEILYR